MKQFEWKYCAVCEKMMVICPDCGNNCCNGGTGKLPSGEECGCEAAYQFQKENHDKAPPRPDNWKELSNSAFDFLK